MKNFIIEDTEETLEALEHCFPTQFHNMVGKVDNAEVLIASVKNAKVVELEYWVLDEVGFAYAKDAVPATLKELLEATNALN